MPIPNLYHRGHGTERIGDDTPIYYADEGGEEEVAVWFQLPFRNYNGYSMQNSLFKKLKSRNIQKVYLVDFTEGVMMRFRLRDLNSPKKIIVKESVSADELSNYQGLTLGGEVLPSVFVEPNSDTKELQRVITADELTIVEPNIERKSGQSYRDAVLKDLEGKKRAN